MQPLLFYAVSWGSGFSSSSFSDFITLSSNPSQNKLSMVSFISGLYPLNVIVTLLSPIFLCISFGSFRLSPPLPSKPDAAT